MLRESGGGQVVKRFVGHPGGLYTFILKRGRSEFFQISKSGLTIYFPSLNKIAFLSIKYVLRAFN